MKFLGFNVCTFKAITFGQFTAKQFVLFEHKRLFSIIFFYFKGDGWQDRWHTHAFNAISFKLFGSYLEDSLHHSRYRLVSGPLWFIPEPDPESEFVSVIKKRTELIKYFPRDSFHKLGHSNGCMTMLLSGPWKPQWVEVHDNGTTTHLNWGRSNVQS